jgi:CBS domain-containing protein
MRVRDLMTPDPASCTPDSTARDAAILMRDNDCGSLPVVESESSRKLLGTVTDRDLAIRELRTEGPTSAAPDDEVEIVREVMVSQQVRRVPVVDENGVVVGIVAQADLAREEGAASDQEVGRIVEAISDPRPVLEEE